MEYENRTSRLAAWILALAVPAGGVAQGPRPLDPQQDRQPPIELDGATLERQPLIDAVLERNRELAAARRAVEAARARAEEARGLPSLGASYSLAPLSPFDSDVRYGQVIEVGQELPWPGTLARRGRRADALAEASEGELEALRRELALAASHGYDDYGYVERALAINAEHAELLRDFQEVATTRYAAGIAPQQAPLAAEVEIAHVEHQEIVLEADRRAIVARLNSLLHRPVTSPLPPPPNLTMARLEALESSRDALIDLALAQRPEAAAARARIAAGATGVELARLAGRPDLRPMASFNSMWGEEAHRWMVGLGLSLPVWRHRVRAGVAEAESELSVEHERLAALEDHIAAEVSTAFDRFEESRHVAALVQARLLPAARDQLRASQVGFETSQVTFLAVIEAERNLRDVELALANAEADAQRRFAALQQALGQLPGSPLEPPTELPEGDRRPGRTP